MKIRNILLRAWASQRSHCLAIASTMSTRASQLLSVSIYTTFLMTQAWPGQDCYPDNTIARFDRFVKFTLRSGLNGVVEFGLSENSQGDMPRGLFISWLTISSKLFPVSHMKMFKKLSTLAVHIKSKNEDTMSNWKEVAYTRGLRKRHQTEALNLSNSSPTYSRPLHGYMPKYPPSVGQLAWDFDQGD